MSDYKWLEDESRPWYDQPKDTCDYIEYTINDVKIMVGTVPNLRSWTKETFASVDAWLNISERLVPNPAPRQQWCPWDIAIAPSLEIIYASLRILDYWIKYDQCKRIYINCIHGGTRSVAIFGFYLMAYHPQDIEKIIATKTIVRRRYDSDPIELAESYIDYKHKGQKELRLILPAIARHTVEKWGNIEDLTREFKDVLVKYRWERLKDVTLPLVFKNIWWSVKWKIGYYIKNPFPRTRKWIHKKLNTRKGQVYKRMGL